MRVASALKLTVVLLLPFMAVVADEHAGKAVTSVESPQQLLDRLSDYPHAVVIASSDTEVLDHEVGLGALQKVRGSWRFKDSERITGRLQRFTWQVTDGFSSAELFEDLSAKLTELAGSELLFTCEGRACGHGAQWANRVFREKILYGRDDLQRYSVFGLSTPAQSRIVIYASSRTSDRHYLHADLIEQTSPSD